MTQTITREKKLSQTALRAFFKIAPLWGLSNDDQIVLLGKPSRSQFFKWKKEQTGKASPDTLERISHLVGIYKSLQILLPDQESADSWIKKPNAAALFSGKSALDRLLLGQVSDLFIVRQYLDAQRGGWA